MLFSRFSLVLLACLWAIHSHLAAGQAPFFRGERILVHASIDEQPALFAFDTGASVSAIFSDSAKRLGIGSDEAVSKEFDLKMFGQQARTRFPLVSVTTDERLDGVFAWSNLSASRLLIDGYDRIVATPSALPRPEGWRRWTLDEKNGQVFFQATHGEQPFGRVFLDTGATCGLRLRPDLWKAYRESTPDSGVTLGTFGYALGKPSVHELAWAREIRIGDLILYDVPVGPLTDEEVRLAGDDYVAMIGVAAFRNLRVLLDREDGRVWTQSMSPAASHNRAGAIFARKEDEPTLIARVLEGSPADEAGLREGDILVKIDGDDASSADEVNRRFFREAGTEVSLDVRRGEESISIAVVLKNLLP